MTKAPHSRKQKRLQRELNLGRLDSIGLGRWSGGQRVAMTLPGLTLGIAPLVGVGAGVLIGAIGVGGIILVSCCTFAVLVFGGAVVFDVLSHVPPPGPHPCGAAGAGHQDRRRLVHVCVQLRGCRLGV